MNMRKAPSSWIVTHIGCGRLSVRTLRFLLPLLLFAAALALRNPLPPIAPEAEQEIVRLVNRERQSRGLATLVVDERLLQAARKHSRAWPPPAWSSINCPGEAQALAPPRRDRAAL